MGLGARRFRVHDTTVHVRRAVHLLALADIYRNILTGRVHLPRHLSEAARSLLRHLLVGDVTRRYGCMRRGMHDVLEHRVSCNLRSSPRRSRAMAAASSASCRGTGKVAPHAATTSIPRHRCCTQFFDGLPINDIHTRALDLSKL